MHLLRGPSHHQVLQRDRRDRAACIVEGTTTGRGPVLATITGHGDGRPRRVGSAKAGRFTGRLTGLPVGGPYTITLTCGTETAVIRDLWVGDVWILAGQSNMQGYGDLAGARRSAAKVFMRSMAGVWGPAREPLHLLAESTDPVHVARPCSPYDAARWRRTLTMGAGPGLSFAAELVRRTGVPQGLLPCAHGGTSVAQWDPARRDEGGASLYGSLYQAWASTGQPVAGVLWYQGENDANPKDCDAYTAAFRTLVAGLRGDLGQPDLPILTVQLGRVVGMSPGGDAAWNRLQEQQRRFPERDPRVGVVAAVDLPLVDNIHLSGAGQKRLGKRLARLALGLVHGDAAEAPPPRIVAVQRVLTADAAHVYEVVTEGVVGGLRGADAEAFTLVDAQHRPMDGIIRSEIVGDRVRLFIWSNLKKPGAQLMYGHGCHPASRLTDARDLALPVTGPLPLLGDPTPGPGITAWAGGQTLLPRSLEGLDHATVAACARQEPVRNVGKPYWPEFMNHHATWEGRAGIACFVAEVTVAKRLDVLLGLGYDGPVRLWLDGRQIHDDPAGTNPCIQDRHLLPVRLTPGRHTLTLAMDVNAGQAWGYALRWLLPPGATGPAAWPETLNAP